ncbi:hypothetical protein ACJX0J_033107, partial [Zea mays]
MFLLLETLRACSTISENTSVGRAFPIASFFSVRTYTGGFSSKFCEVLIIWTFFKFGYFLAGAAHGDLARELKNINYHPSGSKYSAHIFVFDHIITYMMKSLIPWDLSQFVILQPYYFLAKEIYGNILTEWTAQLLCFLLNKIDEWLIGARGGIFSFLVHYPILFHLELKIQGNKLITQIAYFK